MFQLKKHHKWLLAFAIIFVVAWGVWTMFLLPASETPNLPEAPLVAPK